MLSGEAGEGRRDIEEGNGWLRQFEVGVEVVDGDPARGEEGGAVCCCYREDWEESEEERWKHDAVLESDGGYRINNSSLPDRGNLPDPDS
jgi:hypothetical protein